MRNRWFRTEFGMGRRQMEMMSSLGKNQGDKPGSGPAGVCVCTKCGATSAHITGSPCNGITCPKCGTIMTRG